MDYIVNNTGIPSSQWGQYKPAGMNPDGPSLDFSTLLSKEGAAKTLIDQLSGGAKRTLQQLKSAPNSISKRDWMDLMHELNAMGAISDKDYQQSSFSLRLVPIADREGNTYAMSQDMRDMLDRTGRWSGNPLEYLDDWAFSLKKWGALLSTQRSPDGTPQYQDVSPVYRQSSACTRVSGLIRGLLSAGLAVSP